MDLDEAVRDLRPPDADLPEWSAIEARGLAIGERHDQVMRVVLLAGFAMIVAVGGLFLSAQRTSVATLDMAYRPEPSETPIEGEEQGEGEDPIPVSFPDLVGTKWVFVDRTGFSEATDPLPLPGQSEIEPHTIEFLESDGWFTSVIYAGCNNESPTVRLEVDESNLLPIEQPRYRGLLPCSAPDTRLTGFFGYNPIWIQVRMEGERLVFERGPRTLIAERAAG